jgi:hypothetical protein
MKHPIFHEDERCYALVPTSAGTQRTPCRITGGLKRRPIRDLDGNLIGYATAYLILMDGATLETPWAEEALSKMWERSNWLHGVWQPSQVRAIVRRPVEWKQFK